MTIDYEPFRKNFCALLDSRGYGTNDAAADLGMTSASVSRYRSGKRSPELPQLIQIAQFFNVSLDWLLGISGDKFEVLPEEIQEVASLYAVASPDDKNVIQVILSKYKK